MIQNWGEEMKLRQDVAVKYATIVYSQTWVTCHYAWFVWSVSCMTPPWALAPVFSKQCMFSINNLLPIAAEEICLIHLKGLWMYLVLAFGVRVVTARAHMLSLKDSNSLWLQVRMSRRRISNRWAHQNQNSFTVLSDWRPQKIQINKNKNCSWGLTDPHTTQHTSSCVSLCFAVFD